MDLKELEARIEKLESIEAIKKVQRSYGYYIEHGMGDELSDLFADGPDTAFMLIDIGTMSGKEQIKMFFDGFTRAGKNPGYLHQTMQLSPIIDVNENGRTAKGRWYGLGLIAFPGEFSVKESVLSLLYENDYIKEDKIWKIKIARVNQLYDHNLLARIITQDSMKTAEGYIPNNAESSYTTEYIMPFHFKHPVTGKETSEKSHNEFLSSVISEIKKKRKR